MYVCSLDQESWRFHFTKKALGPVLATVAEQYAASDRARGTKLADCLRIAGNQVVLTVAYLRGGQPLLAEVSKRLWPIVAATQLED